MDKAQEIRMATAVETLAKRDFGVDLGDREECDGKAGSLKVDFIYESAPPNGVALEVTSLVIEERMRSSAAVRKLEGRLRAKARDEKLGRWAIGLDARAKVNRLESEVLKLMREGPAAGQTDFNPGHVSNTEFDRVYRAGVLEEFLRHGEHLRRMGLMSVRRLDAEGHGVTILALRMTGVTGFSDPLNAAIADNTHKLREARPRQTHLAIEVQRSDASRDAALTNPNLTDAIDMVWVVHRWAGGEQELCRFWSIRRGDRDWRPHDPI